MRTWKPSLTLTFLVSVFVTTTLLFLLVGYLWIVREYEHFYQESQQSKTKYLENRKRLFKSEVDKVIDYINYTKSKTRFFLKQNLKKRVYEAHAIATNIYTQNRNQKTKVEITKMITDALRPIRFNKRRGYFFIRSLNGISQLNAETPEWEGKNLIEMTDAKARKVASDLIDLVKANQEGFYKYNWTKPQQKGQLFPKFSFVKHFEHLDCLIGTGEYLDDFEKDIQIEILDRVSKISYEKDGYIFIGQWDGYSLLEPGKGRNMWSVQDENGVKIVQELVGAAKADGGFVYYVLPKFKTLRSAPKISYAEGIKDWQWYVGTGQFVDEIDQSIAKEKIVLQSRVKRQIYQIAFLLCGMLLLIVLMIRFLSKKSKQNFERFFLFFSSKTDTGELLDEKQMSFSEFETLARSVNQMVKSRNEAEDAVMKWGNVFKNAQWGIVVGASKGQKFEMLNEAYAKMHGYTIQELVGKPIPFVYAPEDKLLLPDHIKTAEEKGHNTYEAIHIRKDGSLFPVFHDVTIVKNDVGEVLYHMVNIQDITDRKQAENALKKAHDQLGKKVEERTLELKKAKEDAEFANNAKSEFLANISHELRNPMHHILSYSKNGVEKFDKVAKSKLNHYFRQIRKSGERLMFLLNDLLDISKMEKGRMTYEMKENDLWKITKEAVIEFDTVIKEKQLSFILDDHQEMTITVCDEFRIGQVIRNLFTNAIRYSPEGKTITVSIDTADHDETTTNGLKFSLCDQGIGIPVDELQTIFEKFTQSSLTKTGAGGTGLGLAICHEIIKSHNGKIWAENNPGEGATFNFLIPRNQSD